MEVNNCGFNRESGIVELDEKPWYEFCCLEDSPWECLERLRDELTSNVDVTRLVPRLRACRVITHCEEDEIFSDLQLKNCRLRMGRLLDILYTKGEKGLQALFDSLERYYPELYHELTGKESTFPTQSESDAAPQWLLTELLNEKRLSCELKSTVAALERQQRLNLQDLQQSADKQNILKTENQEQQEELAKVKEENRELRVQISCLAQEKMALQLKCRELQFEGEQAVQALRWARTDCETERRQSQRLRRDRDLKPSSSTMIDLERQNAKLQAQLCQLSEDFNSQQNSNTKEQELLDQLFNLRQELQNTEELRDQLFEEKSASDIKSEALIEDCLVLQKRIKSLHVDLSEVEKEREQALTWRDEAQSMYSQCMQEKDRYRRQVRELEEKTDSLQHIISKAESTLCFDKDKRRYSELPMSKSEPNLCYKNPSDCSSPTESISSSSDLSTINMCSTSLPTSAFSLTKSLQMKAPSESCLPLLLSSPEHHQSLRWKMGNTYLKSFVPDNATEKDSCTSPSSPWPCSTTLLTSMNPRFSDNIFPTKYMPDNSFDFPCLIQSPVSVPHGSPNSHSPVPVRRGSPNSHSPVPVCRGSPNSHSPVPVRRGSPNSHSPVPVCRGSPNSHIPVPVCHGSPNSHIPVPVCHGSPNSHSPVPVCHGSPNSHSPVPVRHGSPNSHSPVPVHRGSPNSHSPVPVRRGSPNSHSPVPVRRGSPNSHSPVPVRRGSPNSRSPVPVRRGSPNSHSPVPVRCGSPNSHSPVPVRCGSPNSHSPVSVRRGSPNSRSPVPVRRGSPNSHSPVPVRRGSPNSHSPVPVRRGSPNSHSPVPLPRGSPNSHSPVPVRRGSPISPHPVPVPCGSPNSPASGYRGFSNSQSQDTVAFGFSHQSRVPLLTNHPTVLRRTPCLSPSQTQDAGFWISSSPSNIKSEPNRPQSYRPVLQLTVSGPGCLKDQLNITGGNNLGIFVAAVQTDSAANGAGLRPQHQILALEADFGSGRDNFSLESCTKEEANWRLSRCNLPARVSVKHNPDGFMALGSTLRGGDSFYIRLNMELCPTLDGKGSLEATTGEILHVTDTLPQVVSWEISSDGEDSEGCGFWAAEKIDDRQHEPIKTGIIPNYKSAQKLLMSQTADSRSDFKHKRSWWRWWQPPRKMDKDIPKLRHTQQLPSVAGDTKSDDLCLKENEQPAPYVLVSPRQPTYQRPIVLIPELVSEALGGMLSMNPGFRMLSPVEVGSHSSVTGRYKKESVCREESFCVARLLKTKVEQMHLVLHGGLRMAWFLRKAGIHPIILCLHLISKGRKSLRKRLLDFPFGDKVLVKRLQEEEVLLWASSFQFVLVNPEDPGITTAKVVQLLVKKAHEEQERTVWVSPFTN
uniref:caspase recruitment domain-containing protein 11-like isoform X1 n=1 Tax=Myxine glutinosa TaxID=7769 RepID=UPI00358E46FD